MAGLYQMEASLQDNIRKDRELNRDVRNLKILNKLKFLNCWYKIYI